MRKKKVYISGQEGMVGSSILRLLKEKNFKIINCKRNQLDLLDQKKVYNWLLKNKPDIVIHTAGRVGGILHNSSYPANFIFENAQMALNVIHGSYKAGVKKIINLGSACIYPKFSKQPIREEYLLTGKLEETNEAYAIAKILGLKMTEFYNKQYRTNYISLQPTNLYGENDNFDVKSSHVIPALINKFHKAKILKKNKVEIWGTGMPKREFLYVDDLAEAILFILKKNINFDLINIGSGEEVTIKKLANLIKKVVNFKGKIKFDKNKPDGTPRKLVSNKILKSKGWKPKTKLFAGLNKTYNFYKKYDNK
ncbi:GDP-L-fucose synthase [Candidatus Pelagibacter sp.]|nr:GDP-L-fucose synthase [Candidatus Pelagibacter sp.]